MKTFTTADLPAIQRRDLEALAIAQRDDIPFTAAWLRLLGPPDDPQAQHPSVPARGRNRQGRLF